MFVRLIPRSFRLFTVFLVLSLLPSCATIFSGTSQSVKVISTPKDAKVYLNGNDTGALTNSRIKINRAVRSGPENYTNEQAYRIEKEGYSSTTVRDRRKVNGLALALDFLFPPAILVDFLNGSIYKYRRRIRANLIPEPSKEDSTTFIASQEPEIKVEETEPVIIAEPEVLEESVDVDIPETSHINPDAIAVIIGNEYYDNPDIPDVNYAMEDMQSMKQYLIKTFGFREGNIIEISNASLADFNRVFGNSENYQARLYNIVKPGISDVFVYYSGHGAPSTENNQGFLVPVECQDISLLQFEGYQLNTLFDNLAEIPYNSLTIVLDACFSGNSHNGALIKQASPIYIEPRMKLLNKENTVIFSSSSGNQISSWYSKQSHSLFTYYFLRGIKGAANNYGSKSELSIDELSSYLLENVPYSARRMFNRTQTPEIIGDKNRILINY
ncbi:caspase family protein [Chondrinema litorale]|uniref:caspase family protein n=1 Tax=Chondrinema litorale TaxID=2994555 RepID=UPI002542F773|nr:caspase family protein [Chondrinema litorale]UZR94143.1 caspase family protein [Chondrinema litorale]